MMHDPIKLSKEAIILLIRLRSKLNPKVIDTPAFQELVDKKMVVQLSTGQLRISKAMVEIDEN